MMMEQPSTLASTIARILSDTIAPHVTSAHAASRLAELVAIMRSFPWDDAGREIERDSLAIGRAIQAMQLLPTDADASGNPAPVEMRPPLAQEVASNKARRRELNAIIGQLRESGSVRAGEVIEAFLLARNGLEG